MTLVEIRCRARGCGALLATVDQVPGDWSGHVELEMCPRHGAGAPVLARLLRMRGRASWRRVRRVSYQRLRPAVERARQAGRTQVYPA